MEMVLKKCPLMNVKIVVLFCCLFLAWSGNLYSQERFNGRDVKFFQSSANKDYLNHLMDTSGLAKFLKFHLVTTKNNREKVALYLDFVTNKADSAQAIWKAINRGFQDTNPGISLPEFLYNHLVLLMEVPYEKGYIEIREKYRNSIDNPEGKVGCFRVRIQINEKKLITTANYECAGQIITFQMPAPSNLKIQGRAISSNKTREYITNRIKNWLNDKYVNQLNGATESFNPNDSTFEYRVWNIRNQVLTSILSPPHEKLHFIFKIQVKPDSNICKVVMILNGKYSPRPFLGIRRRGNKPMEPGYRREMNVYFRRVYRQIRNLF